MKEENQARPFLRKPYLCLPTIIDFREIQKKSSVSQMGKTRVCLGMVHLVLCVCERLSLSLSISLDYAITRLFRFGQATLLYSV